MNISREITVEEKCACTGMRVSRHNFRRVKYDHGIAALHSLIMLPVVILTSSRWMMVSIVLLVIAGGGSYLSTAIRTNNHNKRIFRLRRNLISDPSVHMFDRPWEADRFLSEQPYPAGEIIIFEGEHLMVALRDEGAVRSVFIRFDDDHDRVMFQLSR